LQRGGKVIGRGHVELSRGSDDDRLLALSHIKLEAARRHAYLKPTAHEAGA
jgi:hypothetical protein